MNYKISERFNKNRQKRRCYLYVHGWAVYKGLCGNADVDVIPLHDLQPHLPGLYCPCEPTVEVVGAVLVITHNAWDHREFVEKIEKWLSCATN